MIHIDYKDSRPLYEQISDKFGELILHGVLEPESQLPSVRNLAIELAINPNTIQKAYSDMERKGFIYSVKGRGNFVADTGKIKEERRMDILEKLNALIQEASEFGIGLGELKQTLEEAYQQTGQIVQEKDV